MFDRSSFKFSRSEAKELNALLDVIDNCIKDYKKTSFPLTAAMFNKLVCALSPEDRECVRDDFNYCGARIYKIRRVYG